MKIYLVGGAVRDKLMGFPIKERDWVVVGGTIEEMQSAGFKQVGKDFPVFLHPKTNEEYALARMERKVKPGYKGFSFDTSANVTLEDDLKRRDLTINAMAETTEGHLIDPFHGKQDLENKQLRHVSNAFIEDPVRILRVGRFLARYAHLGFTVANETLALMQKMVNLGEVNALVAERVWKEFDRALGEKNPEQFFSILDRCNALPILFPHLSVKGSGIKALIAATQLSDDRSIRFAALLYDMPEDQAEKGEAKKIITALCHRYRAPNAYKELACITALYYSRALSPRLSASEVLDLFYAVDVFRRETRFKQFITVCVAIANSLEKPFDSSRLLTLAKTAKAISVQDIISQGYEGNALAQELKKRRLVKISTWLNTH